MRILFFGTVDLGPGYPRSRALLQALGRLGAEVEVVVEPLGGGHLHRSVKGPLAALATVGRLWRARRRLIRRARRSPHPDLVVVGYPAHLTAGLARRLWPAVPRVLDLFLSLQDTLVHDRARFRPGSWGDRLALALDRRTVARGEVILMDTREHCDLLAGLTGRERERFADLPCGDPDAPAQPSAAWTPPAPGEPLQVLFVGTGIPLHGREHIVRAVLDTPEVTLTLVGGDPLPPEATACARITHLKGWVSRDRLRDLHRQSHLALGIFGSTLKADRVVPLKVYNALAEGTPVLTGDSRATRGLLQVGREVLVAPRGDACALAAILRRLAADPRVLAPVAAAGAAAFHERFSAPALACRLAEVLAPLGLVLSPPLPKASKTSLSPTPEAIRCS